MRYERLLGSSLPPSTIFFQYANYLAELMRVTCLLGLNKHREQVDVLAFHFLGRRQVVGWNLCNQSADALARSDQRFQRLVKGEVAQ